MHHTCLCALSTAPLPIPFSPDADIRRSACARHARGSKAMRPCSFSRNSGVLGRMRWRRAMTSLHLAGTQVFGDLMDPAVVEQPGHRPRQCSRACQKSRNSQAAHKHLGPVPDPHRRHHPQSPPPRCSPCPASPVHGVGHTEGRRWRWHPPGNSPESGAPPNGVRARFPPARWATAARRF